MLNREERKCNGTDRAIKFMWIFFSWALRMSVKSRNRTKEIFFVYFGCSSFNLFTYSFTFVTLYRKSKNKITSTQALHPSGVIKSYPGVRNHGFYFCGQCRARSDCTYVQSDLVLHFPLMYVQSDLALHSPLIFDEFLSTKNRPLSFNGMKSVIVDSFTLYQTTKVFDWSKVKAFADNKINVI